MGCWTHSSVPHPCYSLGNSSSSTFEHPAQEIPPPGRLPWSSPHLEVTKPSPGFSLSLWVLLLWHLSFRQWSFICLLIPFPSLLDCELPKGTGFVLYVCVSISAVSVQVVLNKCWGKRRKIKGWREEMEGSGKTDYQSNSIKMRCQAY